MQTLTYGLKRPDNGDYGSTFFPALRDNITQLDGHSHNGVDSPLINPTSMTPFTQSILAAGWVATSIVGLYRQLVTISSGVLYDSKMILFRNSANGDPLMLRTEKASPTTYYVYCNDNTVSLTAYYV